MPIRKENRARYPRDWRLISAGIRFDRAAGRCECVGQCGINHEEEGGRCSARHGAAHPRTGSTVVLTAAHFEEPVEDCSPGNLFAGCQQCHNRYDAPARAAGKRERAAIDRRRIMDKAGQLAFEVQIFGPAE